MSAAPSPALPITAINLPFIGSRSSPRGTFQYLLQAVDETGTTFVIPSWVTRREHFRVGDVVDLHFPFRTADGWHRQQAKVAEARVDPQSSEPVIRALFQDQQPLHHPVFASVKTGQLSFQTDAGDLADPGELLRQVVRDCLLQKQGIGVYFKHLVPLFSRITLFPTADFGPLRQMVLEDVRRRIDENVAALQRWQGQTEAGELSPATLSQQLDLEALRVAVELEIESELMDAMFTSPAIRPYLDAIRLLEQKLYLNYNTLVLLYAHAI